MGNDRAARGDKTSNDRVANRFGRCFDRKKERFDLEQLRAGDHIVEERSFIYIPIYWHHMIVEEVDINQKQIHVIHYYNKQGPSGSGSSVCRSQFTYTKDKFYRIVYEDKECLPAPEVLEKARIWENHRTFNPFTNNCEHFANECKTGKKECHQMGTPLEILGKCSISTVVSYLIEYGKSGWRKESDIKKKVVEFGAKCNPALGILAAIAFEMYLLYRDYSDTVARLDEGKLTSKEAHEVNVKRVDVAVCSVFGHGIGFLLGEIKCFALGTFGGWVLPILGTFVVGAAGDYLGKIVGAYLRELLALVYTELLGFFKEKNQ